MQTRQLLIRYENALNYFIKKMIEQSMWFSIEPGDEDWWIIRYEWDSYEFMDKLVNDNRHFTVYKEKEVECTISCGRPE